MSSDLRIVDDDVLRDVLFSAGKQLRVGGFAGVAVDFFLAKVGVCEYGLGCEEGGDFFIGGSPVV